MAVFDSIQDSMYNAVLNIFGDAASWTPSSGGDAVDGHILLNEPTKKQELYENQDYYPESVTIEYRKGDFVGLYESVNAGNYEDIQVTKRDETVTYRSRRCEKKYDGDTFVIYVDLVE